MGAGKVRLNLNVVVSGPAQTGVMACGNVWVPMDERFAAMTGGGGYLNLKDGIPVLDLNGLDVPLRHEALEVCMARGHAYYGKVIRDEDQNLGCHCELRE